MIKIENLCVSYGDNRVYENFNLDVEDGKITCILGESGCGKTTLLNAVVKLIKYGGHISEVKVSYIFQSPRLVPNLTLLQNLTLVGADRGRAESLLKKLGIADKTNCYPNTLSGGQAQRASLARAFLYDSDTVLMDEPFASLDLKTKLEVMNFFVSLMKEGGKTALFVTHDIDEALYLSDRVVVIEKGRIKADFTNDEKCAFGAGSNMREEIVKVMLE